MEIHVKIIGVLLIGLAGIHVVFPRYFNWKQELATLSLINRQIMWVHTFFIAVVLFFMGLFCWMCAPDLMDSKLGKTISAGYAAFWILRLFFQFFVYSPKLWKGKVLETAIHIVFSMLWLYFSIVFLYIAVHG